MNFVSTEYAILLALTWIVYWVLPWHRARAALLLGASYIFYMSWDARLIVLILLSTAIDYVAGLAIEATEGASARKRWLTLSVAANLGILGVFKYFGFFVDSFIGLLHALDIPAHERTLQIVLPLGISFYTFQSMSYTIDIYRGHLRPTRSLLEFATFVAFFPQLVAGPIVRARDFLPQLTVRHRLAPGHLQAGIDRILVGLVKKAVLADNLAPFVDRVFAAPGDASGLTAWAALIAFYGQIYWDFSGYSDIAIGSARLFGFRLRENFDAPYRALNPRDFWRRWHISLSTWLRDYLYIPLGGNRGATGYVYRNLLLTMLLGGLWHGAAWHFVIWGAFHGALLIAHRLWERAGLRAPAVLALPAMFVLTLLGWLVFRADSVADIATLGGRLLPAGAQTLAAGAAPALGVCLAGIVMEVSGPDTQKLCARGGLVGPLGRGLLWAGAVELLLVGAPPDIQSFIYFVF